MESPKRITTTIEWERPDGLLRVVVTNTEATAWICFNEPDATWKPVGTLGVPEAVELSRRMVNAENLMAFL